MPFHCGILLLFFPPLEVTALACWRPMSGDFLGWYRSWGMEAAERTRRRLPWLRHVKCYGGKLEALICLEEKKWCVKYRRGEKIKGEEGVPVSWSGLPHRCPSCLALLIQLRQVAWSRNKLLEHSEQLKKHVLQNVKLDSSKQFIQSLARNCTAGVMQKNLLFAHPYSVHLTHFDLLLTRVGYFPVN